MRRGESVEDEASGLGEGGMSIVWGESLREMIPVAEELLELSSSSCRNEALLSISVGNSARGESLSSI